MKNVQKRFIVQILKTEVDTVNINKVKKLENKIFQKCYLYDNMLCKPYFTISHVSARTYMMSTFLQIL